MPVFLYNFKCLPLYDIITECKYHQGYKDKETNHLRALQYLFADRFALYHLDQQEYHVTTI